MSDAPFDPIQNELESIFRPHSNVILAAIERLTQEIRGSFRHTHARAFALALEIPTISRGDMTMPNYELKNDQVVTITLKAVTPDGAAEPLPTGDAFTVTNSDPVSLNAVIGADAAGNPALVVNALRAAATGITVTVSDSAGLKSVDQVFDIVLDVSGNLVLDVADAVSVPQAVPTA